MLSTTDTLTCLLVAIAGINDVRTGKISNWITYPGFCLGLLIAVLGHGPPVWSALIGFGFAFVTFLVLYLAGWMGGGDVKLMAAVGMLKGYPFILHAMFYSIFFGGLGALLVLVWRGELLGSFRNLGRHLVQTLTPGSDPEPIESFGGSIPFGAAICFGTLIAMTLEVLHRSAAR